MNVLGQQVEIFHGYGGHSTIRIAGLELQNVKNYSIKGESGRSPELTVTIDASSVIFETKEVEVQTCQK